MASTGYSCSTEGAVALAAATPKSILGVSGPASFGVDLRGYELSLDGISASVVAALVEICAATFGANAPGTNSTTVTPNQVHGRAVTAGFTAAKTWTTEPTTLTVIKAFLLTPNSGTLLYDWPLERSPDSAVSQGFVIRMTATATVNARATFTFGRC